MYALTMIGTLLPFVLLGSGVVWDAKYLALAGYLVGLVSPSLGHLWYRRRASRGLVVRLLGGAMLGLAVLAVRGAKLADAPLGLLAISFVIAIVTFITGCVLDVFDQESAARSRNV